MRRSPYVGKRRALEDPRYDRLPETGCGEDGRTLPHFPATAEGVCGEIRSDCGKPTLAIRLRFLVIASPKGQSNPVLDRHATYGGSR
jgi:hypothetical protein